MPVNLPVFPDVSAPRARRVSVSFPGSRTTFFEGLRKFTEFRSNSRSSSQRSVSSVSSYYRETAHIRNLNRTEYCLHSKIFNCWVSLTSYTCSTANLPAKEKTSRVSVIGRFYFIRIYVSKIIYLFFVMYFLNGRILRGVL